MVRDRQTKKPVISKVSVPTGAKPIGAVETLVDAWDVSQLSYAQLRVLFSQEIQAYLPTGRFEADPRNDEPVLFNPGRAGRPHDSPESSNCVVCTGGLTRAVDVAELSQGRTLITKNLYPALHHPAIVPGPPEPSGPGGCQGSRAPKGLNSSAKRVATRRGGTREERAADQHLKCCEQRSDEPAPDRPPDRQQTPGAAGIQTPRPRRSDQQCFGLHFVQWTSTVHDQDWPNLPAPDRLIVLKRLAALEQTLLTTSTSVMPDNRTWGDPLPTAGYVLCIKNCGCPVGGSIAHGHQQIGFSNVMPRRFADNLRFQRKHGETYADYILRQTPDDLVVADYGPALLLVPYFMRRPLDMQLVMRDTSKRYLFQLEEDELAAVGQALRDGLRALGTALTAMERHPAYNLVLNTGPGAGIYLEFLPYSQELGGFEQAGLFVCQSTAQCAATQLREALG